MRSMGICHNQCWQKFGKKYLHRFRKPLLYPFELWGPPPPSIRKNGRGANLFRTLQTLVFCPQRGMLWPPMSVKVKICGITNAADALAAVAAGADALGFMFYEASPRRVSIREVAEIVRELPPLVIKVGVFVDASEDTVMRAISDCGLNLLQFHGRETPEYCKQFGLMSMKAFRIRNAESLAELTDYATDAWLLDSFVADKIGGTGEKFNWDLAIEAKKLGRPIFLAGGLTPANVADAVKRVQPFGVDVSSGVEAEPGRKDHAKVREFVQAARSVGASENAF
jgi:phosphoribosylanthranilate isomerase